MRSRLSRFRRGHGAPGPTSSREAREADLFWSALVGAPSASPAPSQRGYVSRAPRQPRRPGGTGLTPAPAYPAYPEFEEADSVEEIESVEEVDSVSEALPAGLTASPCDIAKTSETLDSFALDSSKLTAAHRTIIGTIAGCILALRGGSRPIRNVEIVGFTDPTGGGTHNLNLGQRRAEAVRDALVAELNRRTAGSAASFTFLLRSVGKGQQIPGGAAANRRVEVFVQISVTNAVVHSSDTDTHEIASNLGAAGLEHFCCVKETGDIILEAEISPNIPGAAGGRLTWEATGTTITSPAVGTDTRTAKLSSAASGKFPIRIKWDGAVVRQAVVWVIWSQVTVTATRAPSTPALTGGLTITAGIDHSFKIEPAEIITDADRPALHGVRTAAVPGAAQTHVISGNTLAGGAGDPVASSHKWDASRQIRVKILNPHLYPVAKLSAVDGHLWTGQPIASTEPEAYPANNALGNDDTHDGDETNDPYTSGGVVTARDNPRMSMVNSTGANNDTMERRYHFREFLRVNLDTTWYRASDFSLWRFHGRFRRASGAWTNNSSTFAQDNNGF